MSSEGRGRWLLVVLVLAACGGAAGAWAGRQIDPDQPVVVVSLAVAGFGLGGLVGALGLGLRALLLRAIRLFGRSRDSAAPPSPAAPETPVSPASDPEPEPMAPEPEPEPLPAPPGEEPGWYPDPQQPERNRYWDGQAWTAHLSRDRESRPRRRSPRGSR